MKLSQWANILKGVLHGHDHGQDQDQDHDHDVSNVTIDTRTLQKGDVFFALRGEHFDGHDFIDVACQKGAEALIVSRLVETSLPYILVPDTQRALGQWAAYHRRQFTLPVVAVTGSCGKTTVKEMIDGILQHEALALASRGNFNNEIGVPLSLLRLNDRHRYAVFELAASHVGEIAYTTRLVKPKVAVVTRIAAAHLEGFGSLERVADAKAEIFQGLSEEGVAIINADDPAMHHYPSLLEGIRVIRFGVAQDAEVQGTLHSINATACVSFVMRIGMQSLQLVLAVPGEHNMYNALAAAAACWALEVPLTTIKKGLEQFLGVKGRLNFSQGYAGVQIIDDTYNANPCSVHAALKVLIGLSGEACMILGDCAELGAGSEAHHRMIGQWANDLGVHRLYTYGQLSAVSSDAFLGEGQHFTEINTLLDYLRPLLHNNMNVLVKGSRCNRMERVVAGLQKTMKKDKACM